MAGDYTRYTFRPENDRSGVLLQQGRVQLDADFNELVELLHRRARVQTVDIIGRNGVPRSTSTGFKIDFAGSDLVIGTGRCYVDGLLAENRGAGEQRFDDVWGERIGSDPVRYEEQPYLRPVLDAPTSGRQVAYLDVWTREVTAAEEPSLVEPAIGVDTAARLQTVWAVRLLEVEPDVSCDGDWSKVDRWVHATAASSARLTTSATGVAVTTDPCLVQPSGGYRGVENRLYRVEIHDDGRDGGAATMKWSRDNGAVAVEITGITDPGGASPKVGVRRVGRDAVLRFRDGDWIELLDDALELSGRPGLMARIAPGGVDAQAATLTLEGPIDLSRDAPIDVARNARARRWDQREGVGAGGVVMIDGAPFDLEDGVSVTLDLGDAGPRAGDFWCFAARTSGGEDPEPFVESLVAEPPRGIRHHYARLALIEDGRVLSDCRVPFPADPPEEHEDCGCDVCVTPQSHADGSLTIQDAVNRVRRGGRVCLGTGTFALAKGLRIVGSRGVTLSGQGRETILVSHGAGAAIDVDGSIAITIEDMTVTGVPAGGDAKGAGGARPELGIVLRNTIDATVQRCLVVQSAALAAPPELGLAVPLPVPEHVTAGIAIGLSGLLESTVIRDNAIMGEIGIASLTLDRPSRATPGLRSFDDPQMSSTEAAPYDYSGIEPVRRHLVTIGLRIEDNVLACRRGGIDLGRTGPAKGGSLAGTGLEAAVIVHAGATRLARNVIQGCIEAAIIVTGLVPGSAALRDELDGEALGLEGASGLSPLAAMKASRLDIGANVLSVTGHGIVSGCDLARIEGNDIAAADSGAAPEATGILLLSGAGPATTDQVDVLHNHVRSMPGYGIRSQSPLMQARIAGNVVDGAGRGGIAALAPGAAADLAIDDNVVLDVALGPELDAWQIAPGAITVLGAAQVAIRRNRIDRIGVAARDLPSRAGAYVGVCGAVEIRDNQVTGIGPSEPAGGRSCGIEVRGGFARANVTANTASAGPSNGRGYALALGDIDDFEFDHALIGGAAQVHLTVIDRVVVDPRGDDARRVAIMRNAIAPLPTPTGTASKIDGNVLSGTGRTPVALVHISGDCTFSENSCDASTDALTAAVWLAARDGTVIASANRIRSLVGGNPRSMALARSLAEPWLMAAVVGNVTDRGIFVVGYGPSPVFQPLGPPWAAINLSTS